MSSVPDQLYVSVVIPAHNGDSFIAQAINSVLSQSYSSYEVIVVDDGSTDDTQMTLQEFGDKIRMIRQENQGVAAARNRGIAASQGRLIALLDQDDLFLPDKLAQQVECFKQHPQVDLVNSGWRMVDTAENFISEIRPWEKLPDLTLENLLVYAPILPSALMFRRRAWEQVRGFDPRFDGVDEVEFVWRLALAGCQAIWLPQVTVNYRQHPQAVSSQNAVQRARTYITAQDQFLRQAQLESVQHLESKARYEGLSWMAWHLYHTGNYREMAEFLAQALSYSPYTLGITIANWLQRFSGYCLAYGYSFPVKPFRQRREWQHLLTQVSPKKMPRVSVIIPTYNSDRYVERAVKSVLEQDYSDYEVIVIDDGSTDRTAQVLEPY
ncbi:MAG: glycosyltransferase family 2 protein, partial [Microcoleaceae cyanobacterium]